MSRSRSAIFAITPFVGKCQSLQMSPTHFCAGCHHFRDIKTSNFLPQKSRSGSWRAIFAITPFDGKCKNLQT